MGKGIPTAVNPDFTVNMPEIEGGVILYKDGLPDRYIVVMNDEALPERGPVSVFTAQAMVNALVLDNQLDSIKIEQTFHAALRGFSASMSRIEAIQLAADPRVRFVEQVRPARIRTDQNVNGTSGEGGSYNLWGKDRIDQAALPLNNIYHYTSTGSGVHVYIADEGIADHEDFAGRLGNGFNAAPVGTCGDETSGNLGNGYINNLCDMHHGNNVAGIVGGEHYGVAPGVTLHSVRVFNCCNAGDSASVVAALNWIAANHIDPAVANMSFGFDGPDAAASAATKGLLDAGVFVALAAGNIYASEDPNACLYAPADIDANTNATVPACGLTSKLMVVGNAESNDTKRSTSYNGPCVNIWAPGVSIYSAAAGNYNDAYDMTGTSQAAPHVVGVAARYLQGHPTATPLEVKTAIQNAAVPVITGTLGGASNKLLQSTVADGDCIPATCASLGKQCGTWSNGCSGTVTCPACTGGTTCDASGQCVAGSQACDTFVYSTTNTSSATYGNANTKVYTINLTAGTQYVFSTCTTRTGDNYLRLYQGATSKATDDDGCGTSGGGAKITYTPTASGTFTVQCGCYNATTCSATLKITPAPACPCTPNCSGLECGNDPVCGSSCGTCTSPEVCSSGQCVCVPSCAGKTCGDDGCGGSCGSCSSPAVCNSGSCCSPATCSSLGKQCGSWSDGCGGTLSCGTCGTGYTCNVSGQCVVNSVCDTFAYSTSGTGSATYTDPDTRKYSVKLTAGTAYLFSTCTTFTGDPYMRLYQGTSQKTYNDDGCGTNAAKFTYTPTATGTFDTYLGCYSSYACTGTLKITPAPACP